MEDDRDGEHLLHVTLGAEIMGHYARRAEVAGRRLEDQLGYEHEVSFGLTVPNPGDVEATQRGQIFRRMSKGRILQG